MQSLTICAMKF